MRALYLSCLCLLLVASSTAQLPRDPFNQPGQPGAPITYSSYGSVITLTIYTENKARLDRQAVIKLTNKNTQTAVWQTSDDRAETSFGDVTEGTYGIEVSAVGYLSSQQEMKVQTAAHNYRSDIFMKRDPASVELNAPTAKKMPAKARRLTLRGVVALKAGNLKEAERRLDAAVKIVPASSDLNFLLGYLFFQRKDLKQAETHLREAVKLDPGNVQALSLLGRVHLLNKDYAAAQSVLEQAVTADPEYWMAHNLLADTYLKRGDYEKSKEQALLAIEKGKGGGTLGQIVLGEALANMGHKQEALDAFNAFLKYTPGSPTAPQVHALIAELESPDFGRSTDSTTPRVLTSLPSDPALNISDAILPGTAWQPAGIDEMRPAVATGVACPYETVVEGAGLGVKQLVDDISRFNAIEDLVHEDLNELGQPTRKETRKFNYVAAISEPKPGFLAVDEFRSGRSSVADFPDQIATRGLPALALVFHPDMRDNFTIACEGLGQWNGQATWLLHFRQRDDRPNRIREYKVGERYYPIDLKGRAWVMANTFHIVRIESELVKPLPKIQLLSEHYTVDYGPVMFKQKSVELWLPKNAELYFYFRKHRYFRRHRFDDFMLFSVDADQKVKEPKAKVEVDGATVPPPR